MIAKDDNMLVKVLKKAVGLPTGNSSCGCSAPVPAATECCNAEAPESASKDCGCGSVPSEQDKPSQQ